MVDSRAVNATDSEGNTALHIATQQGMLECMKILLRNGANVEAGKCVCLCTCVCVCVCACVSVCCFSGILCAYTPTHLQL